MLEEKLADFDAAENAIFEHKISDTVQHSKLKSEGTYQGGLFRSMKSYYLLPPLRDYLCPTCGRDDCGCGGGETRGEGEPVVRAKGLPRSVQKAMVPEHFRMGESDQPYFANYALRPTPAQDMTIGVYTKRNSSCINFKRRVEQARQPNEVGGIGRVVNFPRLPFRI